VIDVVRHNNISSSVNNYEPFIINTGRGFTSLSLTHIEGVSKTSI